MTDESRTTVHIDGQPFEVKLTRYAKGGYGWEISVKSGLPDALITKVEGIDKQLREKFGAESDAKGEQP